MPDRAFIQMPGDGRVLNMGPFQMTVKADADQTGGTLTVLEAEEPAHFGPPLHIHDDAAEAFYVLDGEYVMFVDGDEYRCPAGSFIYIPAGTRHGFRVGATPSRKLNIYLPAAMVGYFDELAESEATGTALDADELTTLAARYAMRVLGPVPEGYL
jgi:quercetin dioxygenase-like cupin family protein